VRRVIGTVPIEADGSAYFKAPALRSISLNLLDAEGRTLMRMGSDMHVMPGEEQSCVGCHENRHGATAPALGPKTPLAATRKPVTPTPAPWRTKGLLDYQKVVQPVFDKYCLKCHSGPTPKGGMSLTSDRTRFFCLSYDNLVDRGHVDFTNVFALDHDENTPLALGALVSKLRQKIETDHCGQAIPRGDRYRIYAWIDANVPYYSTYTYAKVRGIGARDSWGTGKGRNFRGWMVGHVARVFEKRCLGCHRRTVHNQALYGTASAVVSSKLWTVRGVTAHVFPGRYPISAKYGPELRVNLTQPSHSLMLQAPLAKTAGGLGFCRTGDGKPVFANKADPDYQHLLFAVEQGKARLYAEPRVDMPAEHVDAVRETVLAPDQIAAVLGKYREAWAMKLSTGLRELRSLPKKAADLAGSAKATSPDRAPIDGRPPRVSEQGAIDGNHNTIWDDVDGRKMYRLRLTFGRPIRAFAISIIGWGHHDFSPKDFAILCDGKAVGTVENAEYDQNRLGIAFPTIECTTLELAITDYYGGSPAIRELGVYDVGK